MLAKTYRLFLYSIFSPFCKTFFNFSSSSLILSWLTLNATLVASSFCSHAFLSFWKRSLSSLAFYLHHTYYTIWFLTTWQPARVEQKLHHATVLPCSDSIAIYRIVFITLSLNIWAHYENESDPWGDVGGFCFIIGVSVCCDRCWIVFRVSGALLCFGFRVFPLQNEFLYTFYY